MTTKVLQRFESFFKNQTTGDVEEQVSKEVDNPAFEMESIAKNVNELKEKIIEFKGLDENLLNLSDEEFLTIENCPSMSSTFETFISLITTFYMKISLALGIFIKFQGEISYLSEQQFFRMLEALKNFTRSFLFTYETSDDKTRVILWRLEGIEQIFCLPIHKNDGSLGEFITKFLIDSLKAGCTGLHPSCDFEKEKINTHVDLKLLYDNRGYNLLLLAVESGKTTIVKILLNLGFDVNFKLTNGKTAADLAYEGKHFDILLNLLKANSKYPMNFNEIDAPEDLKKFIEISKNLHSYIKFDDQEKVNEILEQNPNLRHFYDIKNLSAVAASISHKSFEIYKILLSKNIYIGQHESFQDILSKLTHDDRVSLRKCHDESSQNFMEDHIMTLMGNSGLGPDDNENQSRLSYALQAFQIIDKIPQISLILKIAAALKNFKITFDFKRDDVQYLDPSSEPYTNGIFYLTGMIYIAAANLLDEEKFHEVCGTIAHELCHFVMFKVFNNLAKPFTESDGRALRDFQEISTDCQNNMSHEVIISLVYECYPRSQQHAELIVRVPHILAHYFDNPEKIEELKNIFSSLFEFFNNRCIPEMQAALPRFIEQGKETEVEFKLKRNNKILLWSLLALFLFGTAATFGTYQSFKPPPVYKWSNLTDELRNKALNREVNFQGENVTLKEITNSKALDELSIKEVHDLFNDKPFNISIKLENKVDFVIKRKFEDEINSIFTESQVFEVLHKSKGILLSDFPGAGKTTTFRALATSLKSEEPRKWISYIDLKKFTKEYKNFEKNSKTITRGNVLNFISRKILRLSKFDSEVFEICYDRNEVIFLWDGVDEIAPAYDGLIIQLIKFIKMDSENLHLISTRTYLQNRLKNSLNLTVFRLHPFEPHDRVEFVIKFMENRGFNYSEIDGEMKKIQPFFDKILNRTCDEDNPLMLNMICTIYFDDKMSLVNGDILKVYEKFIELKFKLIGEKGTIVENDRVKTSLYPISISQAHQYYAMKLIFDSKLYLKSLLLFHSVPQIKAQEISRYGILEISDDGNFNFIHRTFAEYFVAQYIIENIYYMGFFSGQDELEARLGIISRIINDTYRGYKVITNFIEDFLKRERTTERKPDRKIIEAIQKDVGETRVLNSLIHHRYNKNSVLGYLEFFSSFWQENYEILRLYWHVDDDENIFQFLIKELQLYKVENKIWLERFTKLTEKHFKKNDLDVLLPSQLNRQRNLGIWLYYIWTKHSTEINQGMIVEWAQIENIENLLKIESTVEFIETLKNFLPLESVKKIFLCEFSKISISMNNENLENFWNLSEKTLSPDEMKRALLKQDFCKGAQPITTQDSFHPNPLKDYWICTKNI